MTYRTLEENLRATGNAVKLLRSGLPTAYHIPKVPPECSNWREEQTAWRETVALLDLTHHMTELAIEGPDAIRLFSELGVNSFAGFKVNKAKQFVCCNHKGYMIGDGILFFLAENSISLLGLPLAHNWVQYHAESGRYDVRVRRDEATESTLSPPRGRYRFQLQGPKALDVLRKATNGALPDIKFFNIGEFEIAGRKVRALRHGMSSAPGLELFGPWAEGEEIRAALLEAGSDVGLRQVGYLAYPTTTLESGWIPAPLPAIYSDDEMKGYREWLPPSGWEAGVVPLAGSMDSEDIRDYYVAPHELGYAPFIKFDHDFIGREALESMNPAELRHRVTLAWNADDVLAAMRTLFTKGDPAKFMNLPWSPYAWNHDKVLKGGKMVGVSRVSGYSYNERAMLSLAVVDPDVKIGDEVTLVWGEAFPRPAVPSAIERHAQIEIRAIVSPCPYSEVARTTYAEGGWRSQAAAP